MDSRETELIFEANGDYSCPICGKSIFFKDTFKTNKCPCCDRKFYIPEKARFMYNDCVMKNDSVINIKELSMQEQMIASIAKRGFEAKGRIPIIDLNKIRSIS